MRVGSLFAGVGGMELGLERAGMEIVWQVEINPFCRRVLKKHWPHARQHEDVREVGGHNLEPVDLICGGFPCQDISTAGKGAGIEGERSGLWSEFARIISEVRPQYALMENVSALLVRGLGTVLRDLAEIGYDAEWDCVPASAVGAHHQRDRVFIVAYPNRGGWTGPFNGGHRTSPGGVSPGGVQLQPWCEAGGGNRWLPEPSVDRVVNGVPSKLDKSRHAYLGNAVVPQVAEWIGRRIMEADNTLAPPVSTP